MRQKRLFFHKNHSINAERRLFSNPNCNVFLFIHQMWQHKLQMNVMINKSYFFSSFLYLSKCCFYRIAFPITKLTTHCFARNFCKTKNFRRCVYSWYKSVSVYELLPQIKCVTLQSAQQLFELCSTEIRSYAQLPNDTTDSAWLSAVSEWCWHL